MRSPRRTAQTASALMVGLALVSAISVFGASASRSATSSVDNAIRAQLIVTGESTGSGSFSTAVAKAVSDVPGVTDSTTVYGGQFEVRGSLETLKAISSEDQSKRVILRHDGREPAGPATGSLLIDSTTAKSDHLSVGDTVLVKFALTGSNRMRIGGIFQPNALIGSYLVGAKFFLSHYENPLPGALLLSTDGNAAVENGVNRVLAPYPTVQVQSLAQFEKSETAQVNELLGLVYALLGLAVLIALIGIVNTLMLSVFERTREIGLLRAVGMRRSQVRTMIRSESVILALFGAGVGVLLGTGLGVALVSSLSSQGITDTVVPGANLVASWSLRPCSALWPPAGLPDGQPSSTCWPP